MSRKSDHGSKLFGWFEHFFLSFHFYILQMKEDGMGHPAVGSFCGHFMAVWAHFVRPIATVKTAAPVETMKVWMVAKIHNIAHIHNDIAHGVAVKFTVAKTIISGWNVL